MVDSSGESPQGCVNMNGFFHSSLKLICLLCPASVHLSLCKSGLPPVNAIYLCLVEVATGNLLDLAGGANTALVHSGKLQSETDPFMVHNRSTENNNTVWVRREAEGAGRRVSALLGLDKIRRQGGGPERNVGVVYI